ncbi:VOC family protein [Pontibacter sp. G13]|uniref:VOC family protein n=1 Tax=Pontibacter sp. G13 TaxID=3074898 RepID=UPI00288AD040|nr:VOC family protein [Pontibacter sp. G13]WNJ20600.1 VOC family protein [Pontibacter sp. G13]
MTAIKSSMISPCLWFDNHAEEAIRFYISIFPQSRIVQLHPVLSTFVLDGMKIRALNGGPEFPFTPAVSLFVECKHQRDIDYYWESLLASGGQPKRCGWLKDRFGMNWQVVPEVLGDMMSDPDHQKSQRVHQALVGMEKLEIQGLIQAFQGVGMR